MTVKKYRGVCSSVFFHPDSVAFSSLRLFVFSLSVGTVYRGAEWPVACLSVMASVNSSKHFVS